MSRVPSTSKLFKASQFTPTAYNSADDKAKFANHFVRFVQNDFRQSLFFGWFYTRLSMMFGHIAHYNLFGFYGVWFSTTAGKLRFLQNVATRVAVGDPAYTYSDVERVLAAWVQERLLVDYWQGRLDAETEQAERAELARLTFKYGGQA